MVGVSNSNDAAGTSFSSRRWNELAGDRKPFDVTPCFSDWKRFCFVLREIASGKNGRPLSGLEAQKRAQAVLIECGYWGGAREQANRRAHYRYGEL